VLLPQLLPLPAKLLNQRRKKRKRKKLTSIWADFSVMITEQVEGCSLKPVSQISINIFI
jgi:hypothetical protein